MDGLAGSRVHLDLGNSVWNIVLNKWVLSGKEGRSKFTLKSFIFTILNLGTYSGVATPTKAWKVPILNSFSIWIEISPSKDLKMERSPVSNKIDKSNEEA